MTGRSALLAIACAVGLTACGGGGPGPRADATSLPQPSARCGPPRQAATTLRFPARDGAALDGAIVGTGPIGVVLLHEYPGPMCGWWPYATYLAHHGMRALLFDFRCFGLSGCPNPARADPVADVAGAMRALRDRGATSIVLLGASLGGVVSVVAGARLHPAAIVDLSGERDLTGLLPATDLDSGRAASSLRIPALFVVSRGDRYVTVADMRAVYRRARSPVKTLTVLPTNAGHGWDMLIGADFGWSPLAHEVLAFIRSNAHAANHTPTAATSVDGCVRLSPTVRRVAVHPAGGTTIQGVFSGAGSTAFVLTNESDESLCSWLPFVATLNRHGYSALLYDYLDPSDLRAEAQAAVRAARQAGARRVVLMGASVGARASIEAAAGRPTGVSAVISLSAERTVRSDPTDLLGPARQVTIPALLISARQDPFTEGVTGPLLRALGSRHKQALTLPGLDHGTALLTGQFGRRVEAAILSFVAPR
jgi:pimeloyl-ACP methyl ester carboxylesterase